MRIAVTGRPGVGKTTLLERVLERVHLDAGGMMTKEIRKCGHRIGFSIIDLATGSRGILASVHQQAGPKIGRYTVNLADLEGVGIAAIHAALRSHELVVIDEIAPMEAASPAFLPAVQAAFDSGKPLLVSTHAHFDHPLVHRIRRESVLYRVRMGNRDALVETITETLLRPQG
jgi:nucleoside-triphosphatase